MFVFQIIDTDNNLKLGTVAICASTESEAIQMFKAGHTGGGYKLLFVRQQNIFIDWD